MRDGNHLFILILASIVVLSLIAPLTMTSLFAETKGPGTSELILLKQVSLPNGSAAGIKIMRPNGLPVTILIRARKGFAVCAHFNLKTMEKHGVTAVMFKGIKTIEEALNTKVIAVTSQARALGIKEGMVVKDALEKMM